MTQTTIPPEAVGLAEGSRGPLVRTVQRWLERFGYLSCGPAPAAHHSTPGVVDRATVEALADLQRYVALDVTGVVDPPTLAVMNAPRCGVPDVPAAPPSGAPGGRPGARVAAYVADGGRWERSELTFGVRGPTAGLWVADVTAAVARALDLWAAVTDLRFRPAPPDALPDMAMRFELGDHGDGYPFDGVGRTLAHAFLPSSPEPLRGDVHFDRTERWSVAVDGWGPDGGGPDGSGPDGRLVDGSGTDLLTVAAHEAGHALGLRHSTDPTALMAPTYRGPLRRLSDDDVAGIRHLYGGVGRGQGDADRR